MTAQYAVSHSRAQGLRAVGGILTGTAIWAMAGYFGIHALFTSAPWTYKGFKVVGGIYLMYLGVRLWLKNYSNTDGTVQIDPIAGTASAFRQGIVITLTNPKSAIFVASVFATALPSHPSPLLGLLAMLTMMTVSVLWYGLMAILFATSAVADAYRRGRRWIDRTAGAFFFLFGGRLMIEP